MMRDLKANVLLRLPNWASLSIPYTQMLDVEYIAVEAIKKNFSVLMENIISK